MELVNSFVEVKCPITGRKEKVFYQQITGTSLAQATGCDNSNGSTTCQNCMAKILRELNPG